MTALETSLRRIRRDLTNAGVAFALVGGMAVSVRTEPRFTRDADLAVALPTDAEAEALVLRLRRERRPRGAMLQRLTPFPIWWIAGLALREEPLTP